MNILKLLYLNIEVCPTHVFYYGSTIYKMKDVADLRITEAVS